MHIHRSRHTRGFTVLPNALLQDRRLTYTARGLLADLLSRPDGWSEDGRRMADSSPQGRLAIAKALRELTACGYYRVIKSRRPDGTFVSEAHVYDTPQVRPSLIRPESGEPTVGDRGANPVKDQEKVTSLPAQRSEDRDRLVNQQDVGEGRRDKAHDAGLDRSGADQRAAVTGKAVTTLFRAVRTEPRLRIGTIEALDLAPLVTPWLERGYGERDLAAALLGGLPTPLHSAAALLRDRLSRKLPPAPQPSEPVRPRWTECDSCGCPVRLAGLCRACAGLSGTHADTEAKSEVALRGRARVRAAQLACSGRPEPARA